METSLGCDKKGTTTYINIFKGQIETKLFFTELLFFLRNDQGTFYSNMCRKAFSSELEFRFIRCWNLGSFIADKFSSESPPNQSIASTTTTMGSGSGGLQITRVLTTELEMQH